MGLGLNSYSILLEYMSQVYRVSLKYQRKMHIDHCTPNPGNLRHVQRIYP